MHRVKGDLQMLNAGPALQPPAPFACWTETPGNGLVAVTRLEKVADAG